MDSDVVRALVTAAIWLAIVVVVRLALVRGYDRYQRRLSERDPVSAARRKTTFGYLVRVAVVLVALIGVWSVLSIFEVTQEVARAFLASSAVLALIAGLALSTPLGNLGSGVLLAFSQPLRLGDRISVGEHTGVVVEMSLTYTALATDEGRRVFVPNQQLVTSTLVNRSVGDPRRIVSVRLPVRMGGSLEDARRLAGEAASGVRDAQQIEVEIDEVGEKTVWLSVSGFAPQGADVSRIASDIRERALAALGESGLLP